MKNRSMSENPNHEFFYISPDKISETRAFFGPNESRHIRRVLRHKKGDHIFASDGQGSFYHLRIDSDDPRIVETEIIDQQKVDPPITFILSVGILKGKRMDYVIEKSTELGVVSIIPMLTKRTVVKYLGGLRRIRLERIAMAAMKQSRSAWLPKIFDVETFDEVVGETKNYDLALIAHPGGDWFPEGGLPSSIIIMVGPEGGFTDEELAEATNGGAKILNLGDRRLRSDTAAVVSLTRVMTLFETKGGESKWPV